MMFMFVGGVSKVLGKGIIFIPEQFEEVAYLRISKVHAECVASPNYWIILKMLITEICCFCYRCSESHSAC